MCLSQVSRMESELRQQKTTWHDEMTNMERKLKQACLELEKRLEQVQEMTNTIKYEGRLIKEDFVNPLWPSDVMWWQILVDICSGTGLVPDGTKLLPDSMLIFRQ